MNSTSPQSSQAGSTPAGKSPARGCLRAQGVALFVLVALFLLVEGVLRFVPVPGFTMEELDPITPQLEAARIEPHPYLAYANRPGYAFEGKKHRISHNSLGFRGPETTWEKPAGVFRIACLGGSSTYGHGPSSNETTWPARLQELLNAKLGAGRVEVINGGCQGYSSFESLTNLSIRMVDFRPDLVLVYHGINDMRCALYPGVRRDNAHFRALWPTGRKPELQAFLERFRTFQIWRRYFTGYVTEAQDLGTYLMVDFGRYADAYAQPTDADLGFENFQRNLVSILEVARTHGAQPVLVTQAMQASDLDGASSKQAQLAGLARNDAILKAVAAERSVPLVDAKPVLEAERDRQLGEEGAQRIFTHEVHLTDEGCELLARTLARELLDAGLVPPR